MQKQTEPIIVTKSVIDDLEALAPETAKAIVDDMLKTGYDQRGVWHQPEGWRGLYKPNPWGDMRPLDLNRTKRISDTLAIVSIAIGFLAVLALVLYFAPQVDAWTPLQ